MKELNLEELDPSDVLACSLDDQLNLNHEQMVGWINFLSCVNEKVLCLDAHLLANIRLAKWLNQTNCDYLKNGILVPIIRKETLVNGELVKVKDLEHLHQIFKQIQMYDGQITKDPETYLLDKESDPSIEGIHKRISDASSLQVRNPSMQSKFESLCSEVEKLGITERLRIKKDWRETVKRVKANYGMVPGRKQIYTEAKESHAAKIRSVADWIYYTNIGLIGPMSIDYPDHVRDVATPNVSKEKLLDERIRKAFVHPDVANFSKLSLEEILEIREDYSKEWWSLRNKATEPSTQELGDVFLTVYGRMLHVANKTSIRPDKGELVVKVADRGMLGVGFILFLTSPFNPCSFMLFSGDLVMHYVGRRRSKSKEKKNAFEQGKIAFSIIEKGINKEPSKLTGQTHPSNLNVPQR